ncbi:MAG: four helix bundle protein [Candidatus Omnitrophota bacterium]|jgi:four helix bundle protein
MEEFRFDFEKLDVYKRALKFTRDIFTLSGKFQPALQYSLGDQLRRAALSVCNNIAEGSGKQTKSAKVQFYGYSLDSARECIPMISLIYDLKIIKDDEYTFLRNECKEICSMLGGLIASVKH